MYFALLSILVVSQSANESSFSLEGAEENKVEVVSLSNSPLTQQLKQQPTLQDLQRTLPESPNRPSRSDSYRRLIPTPGLEPSNSNTAPNGTEPEEMPAEVEVEVVPDLSPQPTPEPMPEPMPETMPEPEPIPTPEPEPMPEPMPEPQTLNGCPVQSAEPYDTSRLFGRWQSADQWANPGIISFLPTGKMVFYYTYDGQAYLVNEGTFSVPDGAINGAQPISLEVDLSRGLTRINTVFTIEESANGERFMNIALFDTGEEGTCNITRVNVRRFKFDPINGG